MLEWEKLRRIVFWLRWSTFTPADEIKSAIFKAQTIISAVGNRFIGTLGAGCGKTTYLLYTRTAHGLLNPSEGLRFDSFQLYLYENENVNVGQFSPVEIRRAEDAASILAALSDPLFDFRTSVIGDVPASGSLSKANWESLKMVRDGYKIRASSDAQAVLLMPFEFSHCLYVNSSAATTPPFLFRANFLLTGIFFDRELDAEIKFRTDPIMRSRCRLQDLDDGNTMKLRKARDLLPN